MMADKYKVGKSGKVIPLVFVFFILACAGISQADTNSPKTLIKNVSDEVFQILKTYPVAGPPEFLPKRREGIKQVLDTNFDSLEMSKLALGKNWKPLSAEQRQEFSSLFYWRLYSFYILRIELYSDQTVFYKNEKITGDKASVLTRISSKQYPEFDIAYRLKRLGDGWKIYDVVIEGVSLVANYRSQFNNFLANKNTFDDLLEKLREKAPDNAVNN